MKILLRLLAIAVLLLLKKGISAQDVYISDPISLRTAVGYELISPRKGGLLLLRDNFSNVQVMGFDDEMGKAWEKDLELDHRRPQVIQSISHENGFSVVYIYRKDGRAHIKIHRYNAAANLTDSLTIAHLPGTIYELNLRTLVSEDRTKLLVYQRKFQGHLWMLAFDLEHMKELWSDEKSINELASSRFFSDLLLDNRGRAYLLIEENNKRTRLPNHHLLIFTFDGSGSSSPNPFSVPMPEHVHNSQLYRYDNLNRQIVGGGLYSGENLNRTAGSFYLRFNTEKPEIPAVLTYQPYSKELLRKLSSRNNFNKELTYAQINNLVSRQDGGILLICERVHFFERNKGVNNTNPSRFADHFAVDYYYDEVFVFSYAPDGTLDWFNILHKKQYSQNDEGAFSSYFPSTTTARVFLLFNDEIRYENTVSAYEITSAGTAQRKTLFNTQHLQLQLRFVEALQVDAKTVVIPSEKRNALKLVKVTLP